MPFNGLNCFILNCVSMMRKDEVKENEREKMARFDLAKIWY